MRPNSAKMHRKERLYYGTYYGAYTPGFGTRRGTTRVPKNGNADRYPGRPHGPPVYAMTTWRLCARATRVNRHFVHFVAGFVVVARVLLLSDGVILRDSDQFWRGSLSKYTTTPDRSVHRLGPCQVGERIMLSPLTTPWYRIPEMCSERDSPLKRLYRRTHVKLTRLGGFGQLVWAAGCKLSLALVHAQRPAWPGETSETMLRVVPPRITRPPDHTRVNWPVDASASGSAQVGATDEPREFRLAGSRQDKRLERAIPLTTHLWEYSRHVTPWAISGVPHYWLKSIKVFSLIISRTQPKKGMHSRKYMTFLKIIQTSMTCYICALAVVF